MSAQIDQFLQQYMAAHPGPIDSKQMFDAFTQAGLRSVGGDVELANKMQGLTNAQAGQMPGVGSANSTYNAGYQAMGGANAGLVSPQFRDQQSQLSQMLFNQANGGGPNPALDQLKQTTNRNIAQQYAMAQANPNDAGSARNLANQTGAMNQQSAADAATMRAQQQLAAQGQLGGMLQGARGQDIGQAGMQGQLAQNYLQTQLQSQIAAMQGQLGIRQLNQNQTESDRNFYSNLIGGGLQGASGALGQGASGPGQGAPSSYQSTPGYAHGGAISAAFPHFADGGGVGLGYFGIDPNQGKGGGSTWGDIFSGAMGAVGGGIGTLLGGPVGGIAGGAVANLASKAVEGKDYNAGTGTMGASIGGALGKGIGRANAGTGFTGTDTDGITAAVRSPTIPAMDPYQSPSISAYIPGGYAAGGAIPLSMLYGGGVPGHAAYSGDTERNDTVPAYLSPGEVVLPRSVTQDPDAAEKAKLFVAAIKKQKMRKAA